MYQDNYKVIVKRFLLCCVAAVAVDHTHLYKDTCRTMDPILGMALEEVVTMETVEVGDMEEDTVGGTVREVEEAWSVLKNGTNLRLAMKGLKGEVISN